MVKIYALTDPLSKIIRYIGVTSLSLNTRLGAHIRKARLGEKSHRANWLRCLIAKGLRPSIKVIETCKDRDRERYWIRVYRKLGFDLVNATDGGDGCRGLPEESRRRIGDATKARIVSSATREKLRLAKLGKRCLQSARQKLRAFNLGIKRGPIPNSVKIKMSAAKIGHSVSAITRAKISAKLKGVPTGRTATHCPNGHAYNHENTFINIRGIKECRTCRKERDSQRYLTRKRDRIHGNA